MTHAFDIPGPRRTSRPQRLLITLAAVVAALAGCGGGSRPSGSPGGDSRFTVSSTVSGLASGQQVSLLLNGNTAGAVVASSNGTYTVGSVAANGSYEVTVGTQPQGECERRHRTDTALEQTLFDYGRYLLASSSRPGGLPANLQGLWNDSNSPAWSSDYHNNINVQMNYWGAEPTDLGDSHEALIGYVKAQVEPMRQATRKEWGASTPGWTARTSQSIFGGTSWEWNTVASAWYAQHLWEHFAFTQDRAYLRDTAYPLIKQIVTFWQARLKLVNGVYMSPNGWSPEHGPREDGVMYDQQIIWDLFQNYLDAAAVLGVDAAFASGVRAMQSRLAPNKIGRWGQLQEWQRDIDDPTDVHRHTSHLFAVYPGRQITPAKTPQLAAAAMVSLKARCNDKGGEFKADTVVGDSRRSWTWPWRAALFARLGDGHRAAR